MTIPTTTMYRIHRYRSVIVPIQVIRTTKASAYLLDADGREYRESLATHSHEIHPTWEGAHARLLQMAEEELCHIRRQLDVARGRCGNIAGMKKP
jgi:hypothetical protein